MFRPTRADAADSVVLSIIVPAHNEEVLLGATLDAIHAAADGLGEAFEVIVVSDASTDRTADVARAHGARVVEVDVHQIAGARNAGARAARGTMLLFVDADTTVTPAVMLDAVSALRAGAVGGGAGAVFEAGAPRWAHRAIAFAAFILRTAGWAAGCFLFARRDAFEQVGGFDERYFASEEIHLSRALKRVGRFVMLPHDVLTSARKAEVYTMRHSLWLMLRMLWPGSLKRREGLEFWYTRHKS
jgi:cellulose synthase/poly-beta-1,6-N-acetylglucosamine synthase-like glycosyltransferase